jgi:hypothetical protein
MADQETVASQQVSATYANRFQITAAPDLVRIAFGEALLGIDATYRVAIILRMSDALELAATLSKIATEVAVHGQNQQDEPQTGLSTSVEKKWLRNQLLADKEGRLICYLRVVEELSPEVARVK